MVCRKRSCRKPLDLWAPGHWEAAAPGNDRVHGYHLNRLYSPLANIPQMVYESQATTPVALQEFKNSVLGETFVPPGGRLTLDVLDRCRRDYLLPSGSNEETCMGVDVGTRLHVVIRVRLAEKEGRSRALFIGELDSFGELSELARRYCVRTAVVDALPEQRAAAEFARSADHRVYLAYYGRMEPGHEYARENGVYVYKINRNEALDAMFDAFQSQTAELPRDARGIGGRVKDGLGEYYREMLALSRVLERNAQGNWVAKYVDAGKADHYAHAEAYCALALSRLRRSAGPGIEAGYGSGRLAGLPSAHQGGSRLSGLPGRIRGGGGAGRPPWE